MNTKHLASAALASALALACVPASASLQLQLTNGATVVTVNDGGAGDSNPTAGAITYIGAVGAYTINVSTGLDAGATVFPEVMDLNSVDVTNTGGSLLIELTQTGLDFGTSPLLISGFIGGTNNAMTTTYALYADATNAAYGMGSLIFGGTSSAGAYSASGSSTITPSGPFSVYERVLLGSDTGGSASFDFSARVPEPGTAALVGTALLALGVVARRREAKR